MADRRRRRPTRRAVLLALAVVIAALPVATRAAALVLSSQPLSSVRTCALTAYPTTSAIANVQIGPVIQSTTATVTTTLAAGSTAGDLLVATISTDTGPFTAPSGWVRAASVASATSETEVWYRADSPSGVSSAAFTSSGTVAYGQLSEWSGVTITAPLDRTGTATASATTSVTVSTSASTTAAGELAITAFGDGQTKPQSVTYSRSAGWTLLGNTGGVSLTTQYAADYELNVASGTTPSNTETEQKAANWAAVAATFTAAPAREAQSFVTQNTPTTTHGGQQHTTVSSSSAANQRTYLSFDLTRCRYTPPANAVLTDATLSLFMSTQPATCRTVDLFAATGTWTEAGITWNTQPTVAASFTSQAQLGNVSTCANHVGNTYVTWDATADVSAMLKGTLTNNGWMLRDDVENASPAATETFASYAINRVDQVPVLTISYTLG